MSNHDQSPDRPLMTTAFHDRESAEAAYDAVAARGYGRDDIHVLMTHDTHKRLFAGDAGRLEKGNKALEGAGVGGIAGGALGATMLGIAAAAATLTVPGLGLVIAGPISGALAGGALGATAGGLVGTLVGAGIPEARAKIHEQDLKDGNVVIGVRPRNDEDAQNIENDWQSHSIRRR